MSSSKKRLYELAVQPSARQLETAKSVHPDYSAEAAFRRNRYLCYELLEEIELHLVGKLPDPLDFGYVGNVVEARNYLQKALVCIRKHGYAKDRR
jgi:hypothetical protein